MPGRDIIVIGGSAGSIEVLQRVVRDLPRELPASIFVVVHLLPHSRSNLPMILNFSGSLPAAHAVDRDPIEKGRIYIAPPDYHLRIERGHMHVVTGPRENHERPCINVTFRSAAAAYGNQVIGVLLSGGLDDGVSGLWEIERRGGVAVVQHPEEAAFPSMPLNALKEIEVDHTVRTEEMATLLTRLVTEPGLKREVEEQPGKREMEARVVDLTCPECRGTIWEVPRENGEIKEFRCRVGHVYSPRTMFAEQAIAQEKALWSAIVALEEGASLAERLAGTLDSSQRQSLLDESRHRQAEADRLRKVLEERKSFTLE